MEPNQNDESLPVTVHCDVCGDLTELDDVCLDLGGCPHLPCLSCLTLHCTADDNGDSAGVKCPVSSCLNGFLFQHQELRENERPPAIQEEEPLQEKEEGEGSQEEEEEESFFCSICMEHKPKSAGFAGQSLSCDHIFCNNCISAHVVAKVELNHFPIGCPNPGCEVGKLEPEDCRTLIPEPVFDLWGAKLCESAFPAAVKFYCPFPDCSALLTNEGDEQGRPLTESECLHCRRLCCAQCRVPWHGRQTCEMYKREMAEKKDKGETSQLVELARSKQWQKCSKCGIFVERTEGCLYILCRCGHGFCYRCGNPMGETHFCQVCHRTYD